MDKSGLPDIYTGSPRYCSLWALGVYIKQTKNAHVTTIMYYLVTVYLSI